MDGVIYQWDSQLLFLNYKYIYTYIQLQRIMNATRQIGSIKSRRGSRAQLSELCVNSCDVYAIEDMSKSAIIYDLSPSHSHPQQPQIDLSHRNYTQIPQQHKHTHTTKLILSYNNIHKAILDNNLPITQQLDLSHNNLQTLKTRTHQNPCQNTLTKKTTNIAKLTYTLQINKLHSIKKLKLSDNSLQFLPLEELKNMQEIDCSNNYLTAMVLPKNSLVKTIMACNNRFGNIMHSLCGNLPQKCLEYVDVSTNCVEDLIIGNPMFDCENLMSNYNSGNCQLFPRLRYLNCNHNSICFISKLPHNIQELNLSNNNLTVDRLMAKNIIELGNLEILCLAGNNIDVEIRELLGRELGDRCEIDYGKENEEQKDRYDYREQRQYGILRQSPYRLYWHQQIDEQQGIHPNQQQYINYKKQQQYQEQQQQQQYQYQQIEIANILQLKQTDDKEEYENKQKKNHRHFCELEELKIGEQSEKDMKKMNLNITLGECNESEIEHCQPSYDIFTQKTEEDHNTISLSINNPTIQQQQQQQQQQLKLQKQQNNRETQVKKAIPQKLPITITNSTPTMTEPLLQKLFPYSFYPPSLITHSKRNTHISKRIDCMPTHPQSPQDEHTLLSKIFCHTKSGIAYIRKLFNAQLTPLYQKNLHKEYSMEFVIREWSKQEFSRLCEANFEGVYSLVGDSGVILSRNPNSFSKYHVLVRKRRDVCGNRIGILDRCGCIYLIQTIQ